MTCAPNEQKERTIAALLALFEGLTKTGPVLALLEDAHWIDPTSLDVFDRLVDRLPRLRALLAITFRPEFAAPWVGRAHVSLLALNRFGRRQALAMVGYVADGWALPAEVRDEIVAKTDGVPLFVEELTKTVIESGLLREENGAYVSAPALTQFAIPSTLQDSLMARLDRLGPVKEIAQIAAAIGREFSYRLLEAVSPIKGPALQDALGQLMAAELVYARGGPREGSYVFKHVLVQDTAYASLLRGRRQRIHVDIADALAEQFADQIESAPATIAHHYTEGGMIEPAARSWLSAARLALSRYAPVEANHYVDAGLSMVSRLPDGADRHSLELALLLSRVNALLSLKGYNSPEVVATLTAAQRLLDTGGGTDAQRIFVLSGLHGTSFVEGKFERALSLAREIVEIADRATRADFQILGYRYLGQTQFFMGQYRDALESLRRAEWYRDPSRHKLLSSWFQEDPSLLVRCLLTWPLAVLGLVDQAVKIRDDVQAELTGHDHAPSVAAAMASGVGFDLLLLDDLEACERHGAELVAYCVENKVAQYRLFGVQSHALARALRDPKDENSSLLRAAIADKRRSGARSFESFFCSGLAQALLMAGDAKGADAALREAFAFVEKSGERFWLADLHRVGGQIALKRPEPDRGRAEACFLKAIDIARSQEARLLELRAATDLARFWRDTGSPNDPRTLLEPIVAAIEGGENTRDVRNARALLSEIG